MTARTSRRSLAALPAAVLMGGAGKAEGRDAVLVARVDDYVGQVVEERTMLASLSDEDRRTANAFLLKLAREGKLTHLDRAAHAIAKLPAHTVEGLRAKARAAVWQAGGSDTEMPRILLAQNLVGSLLADLTGLPRQRPASSKPTDGEGTA